MNTDVPYMIAVKNVDAIFSKMQSASCPQTFTIDFLRDLGFSSSSDRGFIKILKYIGLIDQNGKPLDSYKRFLDHTNSKVVLAEQIRLSFDDLFNAHKNADKMNVGELKGWFRTKTGQSEAVAEKIASTFRAIADYGDFSKKQASHASTQPIIESSVIQSKDTDKSPDTGKLNLVYRFEIHLPDTQNIDTYRAIFKAIKEELIK